MNRTFIRRNITTVSIVIFLIVYGAILFVKPGFIYNHDGSLRQFGINSNKKTILPSWLIAILSAIISYLFVLYYLAIPKLIF